MKYWIVELERSVYIAPWRLGVCLVKENAKRFLTIASATFALARYRKNKDFTNATIIKREEP